MAALLVHLPPRRRFPARAQAALQLAVLLLVVGIAAVLPLASLLTAAVSAENGAEPVIVCLGDSLTAGYGLPPDASYPSLLQQHLKRAGYPHRVVNAGVSGDTSAGGLARLDWVLGQPVQILIVELGANDGLRGQNVDALKHNLSAIIRKGLAAGAKVLLAGMIMPDNYGADYTGRFSAAYPEVAAEYGVPLIPNFLAGVAGKSEFNQADGIHPTVAGTRIVEATVWKALKPLLDKRG